MLEPYLDTCAQPVCVCVCCLQDRNEEQQAADPAFKFSVQFLNTFFWPKLVQGGHAGEPTRTAVLAVHTAAQH